MTWWTSQSCSLTRDVPSTTQRRRKKCLLTLDKKVWEAQPAIGRPTRKWLTRARWLHQSLFQSDHCGVITVRPTHLSVDTSSLSSRRQLAHTATTQETSCQVMQKHREMSTTSFPLELRRLPRISQATTDLSPRLTSTAVLSSKHPPLVQETPLWSRTSLRTTKLRFQDIGVTTQWTPWIWRDPSDQAASKQLESSSDQCYRLMTKKTKTAQAAPPAKFIHKLLLSFLPRIYIYQ